MRGCFSVVGLSTFQRSPACLVSTARSIRHAGVKESSAVSHKGQGIDGIWGPEVGDFKAGLVREEVVGIQKSL